MIHSMKQEKVLMILIFIDTIDTMETILYYITYKEAQHQRSLTNIRKK